MMRSLFFVAALLLSLPGFTAEPVLQLRADRYSYAVGDTAKLTAFARVLPNSPEESVHIGATLNGAAVPVVQRSEGVGLSIAGPLTRGMFTWIVQLYVQDRKLANQLESFLHSLELENAQLAAQLGQITDPEEIADIEAQIAQNTVLIQETNNQLALLRRPFGASQSLSFYAN